MKRYREIIEINVKNREKHLKSKDKAEDNKKVTKWQKRKKELKNKKRIKANKS